jgi:hypothetical protein
MNGGGGVECAEWLMGKCNMHGGGGGEVLMDRHMRKGGMGRVSREILFREIFAIGCETNFVLSRNKEPISLNFVFRGTFIYTKVETK